MTRRDLEKLIHNSVDIDELFRSVVHLSNGGGSQDIAAFSRDEVTAFVSYCTNAVESAPEVPPEPFLTREAALRLTPGMGLFHATDRDARGAPARARVNGKVKTWKREPNRLEIPMKMGFHGDGFRISFNGHRETGYGYVDDVGNWDNPMSWYENEDDALHRNISANYIQVRWDRPDISADTTQFIGLHCNNDRYNGLKISVVLTSKQSNEMARTSRPRNSWPSDVSLDAWRSSGAWTELVEAFHVPRGVKVARNHVYEKVSFFQYIGELQPWQVQHTGTCPLRIMDPTIAYVDLMQKDRECTCGAFSGTPLVKNPRTRRRR